jgi:hypothetical protein
MAARNGDISVVEEWKMDVNAGATRSLQLGCGDDL